MSLTYYLSGSVGFHDLAVFPERISSGSRGGPSFNTSIVRHPGGAESRLPRWTAPLRKYDAREGLRRQGDVSTLLTFIIARIGATYGFRFKDWWDYCTTATGTLHNPDDAAISDTDVQTVRVSDGMPGVGNGVETQFQLVRRYSDGGVDRVRNIQKPKASSVVVAIDSVSQASGWSLDDTTGIVTFGTAPGVGLDVTWGGEFYVPCRFAEDIDVDGLQVQLQDFDANTIPSVGIDEIRGDLANPQERNYGGSTNWGQIDADVQLSLGSGAAHMADPLSAGLSYLLPAAETVADGAGHFQLRNESATNTLAVKSGTSTLVTIPTQDAVEIGLAYNNSGLLTWLSFG